jgi:1-deoxyxylulose-5-phosphate synthase
MQYTTLGNSGLKISRIALGCMSFGDTSRGFNEWALDDTAAEPLFRQAVELGITFWDTANAYGYGTSEEIVGRAIGKYTRREDIVLATKVFFTMHDGSGGSGLSRRAILEQLDDSLRRLGTDYVDLYQIHRFDPATPVEETMEALHDMVKAGMVRYLGASSMWAWQFSKMQYLAELHGWTRFVSMQTQYSLMQREDEREMFGLLADQGVGSIPWSPLAKGRLARPWGEQTARSDTDATARWVLPHDDKPIADAVQRVAGQRGVPMAQVALAWVLHNPVVSAPIVGPTKPDHLADAAAVLDVTLTDDEISALEEHSPRASPPATDLTTNEGIHMRAAFMYGAGDVRVHRCRRRARRRGCGEGPRPHWRGRHPRRARSVGLMPAYEQAISVVRPGGVVSRVDPGRVFDREVILEQTPQGYKDMDSRQALKVLVRP